MRLYDALHETRSIVSGAVDLRMARMILRNFLVMLAQLAFGMEKKLGYMTRECIIHCKQRPCTAQYTIQLHRTRRNQTVRNFIGFIFRIIFKCIYGEYWHLVCIVWRDNVRVFLCVCVCVAPFGCLLWCSCRWLCLIAKLPILFHLVFHIPHRTRTPMKNLYFFLNEFMLLIFFVCGLCVCVYCRRSWSICSNYSMWRISGI